MKLKSPLKPIIDSCRIKFKPYDPALITKKQEKVLNVS